MKKKVVVYDLECLVNLFTYTGINRDDEKDVVKIVISHLLDNNGLDELLKELNEVSGMIGFNNLSYDYPLLHYILCNKDYLKTLSNDQIAKELYAKSQLIILEEYSSIKKDEVLIPQLDLYKIWHFDNKARRTSLKKLEIALNFDNVQDMPYKHYEEINSLESLKEILDYNLNDVKATLLFYTKTIKKLELRKGLLSKYGLDCLNYSDSKIGEELMLKLYCKNTNKNEYDVKKLRTKRPVLNFKDCIPDYIIFNTKEFNNLLDKLKSISVEVLKDSFSESLIYNGFKFDLGTGGIHGANKSGIYEETDELLIKDSDVGSLYPSLAIANNFYPEHLGEEFPTIYRDEIVIPRLAAKASGDKVMADGYKLSANSCYGKSNSEHSFLYDPLYTLKTTLAGQLSLCMLSERLLLNIPQFTIIQINTDGITSMFPRKYDDLYNEICTQWEKDTRLVLEHVYYSKFVMRDVNSYGCSYTDGKVKYKGVFKTNEEMIKDEEYHKNFSQGIIPIAISNYFFKNIPIEESVRSHNNIYDFCKTFTTSHGWEIKTVYLEDNQVITKKLNKTNRYYISNKGAKLIKYHNDGREQKVEADTLVTIFNQYIKKDIKDYDVNYQYYIKECYKIIDIVKPSQMSLF